MRKAINKKECQKHFNTSPPFEKSSGIIHCDKVKYIVRCKTKNINHCRTLILYIHIREDILKNDFMPKYVVFQTKDDFATLRIKSGEKSWLKSQLGNLERIYNFTSKCAFYSSDDENIAIKFCANNKSSGFDAVERLQSEIHFEKEIENRHKFQRKTINRMAAVQSLPRNFKHWVHKKVMNHYIFYDYTRRKKDLTGLCTACNHTVNVPEAKHNSVGYCPYCNHEIKYKVRSRTQSVTDRDTVQIIQRYAENEFIIRIFKYYSKYTSCKHSDFSIYETARIFVTWDDERFRTEWYHHDFEQYDITPWKPGMLSEYIFYRYNFKGDYKAYLYTDNLDSVLLKSPWQYSQLKTYSEIVSYPFYMVSFLDTYWNYPMLEYFLKLRLYRLAEYLISESNHNIDYIINRYGKNINDILGINKSYLPFLQEVNPSGPQLVMIRKMIESNLVPDIKLLSWCSTRNIADADQVLTPLKFMTIHKLIKYAEEQFFKFKRVSYLQEGTFYSNMYYLLSDYNDYLKMSEELNFDMKNDFVLFPENLPREHNRVNELSKAKITEGYNKKIRNAYKRLYSKYFYEKGGFIIIPPKSADEIVAEGHKLHHCVGRYVESVCKKECVILFLRKAAKPEKPYCTLEIKNGKIAQARMSQNKEPPKPVNNFLTLWKNNVLCTSNVKKAA